MCVFWHSNFGSSGTDANKQNSLPCFSVLLGSGVCLYFLKLLLFLNPPSLLPGKPPRHLLDAAITIFCCCGGFGERCQDAAWDPTLSRWGVVTGWLVHQAHVLLVDGEDLHHLPLAHTNLILLQCIVIFDHSHGGSSVAASQVILLGDRVKRRHTHTHTQRLVHMGVLHSFLQGLRPNHPQAGVGAGDARCILQQCQQVQCKMCSESVLKPD